MSDTSFQNVYHVYFFTEVSKNIFVILCMQNNVGLNCECTKYWAEYNNAHHSDSVADLEKEQSSH